MHERARPARPRRHRHGPEDIIFQIRGSTRADCLRRPVSSWRQPEYGNGAAAGVLRPAPTLHDRWWTWQAAGAYGTGAISPANIYPLDGNRFVPGPRLPAHIGGDTWSADAAIRVIDNDPNWRGMMVSLGAHRQDGPHVGPGGRR